MLVSAARVRFSDKLSLGNPSSRKLHPMRNAHTHILTHPNALTGTHTHSQALTGTHTHSHALKRMHTHSHAHSLTLSFI